MGRDLAYLTFYVVDTVVLHSPAVELIKVLARGTDIDVKYSHIGIGVLIPDQHGVFCRVHTADLGAVGLTPVVRAAAAHALNKYDLLGGFAVGKTL